MDDYPANLLALSAVLSDPIYNLIEASSGQQALDILEKTDVTLILLDVQMPGMDGYEVARRIRANPKSYEIPIIFITAYYREEPAVRQGYAVGGHDYLGKPFDPDILKAKVGVYSRLFAKALKLETEKRALLQSEERYRLIVEGAQEIIATIDNTGTITSLNIAFERLTGFKCSDWIGKSFAPLLDSKDMKNVLTHFPTSSHEAVTELFETALRGADGKLVPIEISVQPLKREGEIVGTVGVMRDITRRSRL